MPLVIFGLYLILRPSLVLGKQDGVHPIKKGKKVHSYPYVVPFWASPWIFKMCEFVDELDVKINTLT